MYIESPMENYNKNNPFIILAKNRYRRIMNDIQKFTENSLAIILLGGIIEGLFILISIIRYVNFKSSFDIMTIILFTIFLILFYIKFKEKLTYFMVGNAAMNEFEDLSSLEISDILTLNNERVMNNVNQLYFLSGELKATALNYRFIGSIFITFESLMTIGNIFYLVMSILK